MNEAAIAGRLLALLASGRTFHGIVAGLPEFKAQLESAFDWMKAAGNCSDSEIVERATQLRGVIHRKNDALKRQDIDAAVRAHGEECSILKSFGLKRTERSKVSWSILHDGFAEQMRELASILEGKR